MPSSSKVVMFQSDTKLQHLFYQERNSTVLQILSLKHIKVQTLHGSKSYKDTSRQKVTFLTLFAAPSETMQYKEQ